MYNNLSHFICLIFILLFSTVQAVEKERYRFRTFSPEGGFYYDGINSIQQDKDGFIWILMDNDIYRFDGYQYKRYYTYFRDTNESGNWQFRNIATDFLGKVYVVTTNGLFEYNKISDSFNKILDSNISFLKVDRHNNLWVSLDGKFGRYNEKEKTVDFCQYENQDIKGIYSFDGDESGYFIGSSTNRIYRADYESMKHSLFYLFPSDFRIQSIKKSHNKLWVLVADKGLIKIDIPTATIEEQFDFFQQKAGGSVMTKTLHIDKYGHIWIATQKGLYILNPETKEYQHYIHSKTDPFSLPNNSVWYITEDHQRNIWLGTFSGGLCYVNLDEKIRFRTIIPRDNPLNNNLISGFAEDEKYLWIATEGGGLNRMDKKTEAYTYYQNDVNISNSLSSNNIKSISLDLRHNLWVSMFRGGLDCLDTKTNTFRHFKFEKDNENSLRANDLRKILLEGDSGLWIAYQQNKLVISFYSFEKNEFKHFYFDEKDSNHFIFDIFRGNNSQLWIISHKKLYMMNIRTGEVKDIMPDDSSYLNAQTICVDGNDNVWIGTIGKGLIRYNANTSVFTVFDDILKFNVSSIFSICTDDENNLWMGTDNGLFKYDMALNKFFRFDKMDGVQGQVYYPLSAYKSKTGELYFGGTNGFTIVNPKDMVQNTYKPRVVISSFYIDNVSARPESEKYISDDVYSFPDEITLNYNQSNFGFRFSSDNFLVPEKNRFRYRLKGYDDRWIEVDASNRSVFYSKVPSGTYIFEIVASNNDGVWSDVPTVVKIKRLAAPWFSWYAYIIYFVLFAGILYTIMRYYIQQKRLRLQLYLDQVDKEKKEEIHQSQLRFFTNISHDFRTPLSLIIASLEKLRQEGLKEYYYRILHGNSQRLLNLVNELMDFRTVENGKMPLQVQLVDVNHLVKELAFDFEDYAKYRKIDFQVVCNPLLPKSLYVDKNILEKVVMNLLNNAFKYTNDGGRVILETYWKVDNFKSGYVNSFVVEGESQPADCFMIAVRDTGIGISKESIESVFERFYKVKTVNFDSHLGTGIGLALVRSLVLLHKGTIGIYSEREKGTDIVVSLSSDRDIYNENEFYKSNDIQDQDIQSVYVNSRDEEEGDREETLEQKDILRRDKRRILLVEDNNDLRELLADSLSSDYEVAEAENGLVASNLLEDMEIDMVVSDIMMPVKDGITLCKEMKSNIYTSHIPFIMLTAKTGLESKLEGADSGADIYFEKPLDFRLLHLTIQNIFRRQQQLKEHYAKNYYVESTELSTNQHDNKLLKRLAEILEENLDQPEMDVNYIASELSMSRSKLYLKIKSLTDKSIVEFILSYRLRKAARLIVEEDLSMREIMDRIGLESQSYFTRAFKKEFGETPTAFAAKHRKKRQ